MRRTTTRGLAVLGTALLVAIALAACGGGGVDDDVHDDDIVDDQRRRHAGRDERDRGDRSVRLAARRSWRA